jgi:hypothetical protein
LAYIHGHEIFPWYWICDSARLFTVLWSAPAFAMPLPTSGAFTAVDLSQDLSKELAKVKHLTFP